MSVQRRKIDLEVAGVNHDADRGLDSQRHAIHQRVGHADGLNREWPDRKLLARSNLNQFGFIEQFVLFELAFDIRQRELGAIHRHLELAQNPRQPANVVLVPVGQNDRA